MAVKTTNEILEMKDYLKGKYTTRNRAFQTFRRLYNGEFYNEEEGTMIHLVFNLLALAVDKYTDYMTQAPDWRVIPVDMTTPMLDAAERQEKLLYSQWELNDIITMQQWQAHLQSMLGFFAFEVLPNMESKEKYVNVHCSLPEFVYPMPKSDNIRDLDSVIIESFDYGQDNRTLFMPDMRHDQRLLPNITKYYDREKIVIVRDRTEILRIEHDFGIMPVICGQNKIKPHFLEGTSDLKQVVGLNQYLNDLLSWEAAILEYNSNPITILRGFLGDINKLPRGPGATWGLPENARAEFLSWQGQAPQVENMIRRVQQAIEDGTNINDPTLGRDIPSGTSGAAVQSLMSGIQSAILRKQLALGEAYTRVNETMFRIIEKMFPSRELSLRGVKRGNVFVNKMKGSEINGNYRNRVIWPAGIMDAPARLNTETQKLNSKLQSRYTTMQNIGIESPMDEMKRIREEEEEEIRLALLRQNPTGIDPQRQNEFATAARQIGLDQPQDDQGPEQALFEAVRDMDKIKGDVLYGGKSGKNFVLVVTDNNDKGTILRKLPKGLDNVIVRPFVVGKDEDLVSIIAQEGFDQAPAPGQAAPIGL